MFKRRLRRQCDGDEPVMYPFVLIIAFMMIIGFLAMGLSKYARSGQISSEDYSHYDVPFGMYNMTTVEAYDGDDRYVTWADPIWGTIEGYEVTADDVIDYVPYPTHEDPFLFSMDWDDRYETKYVHIIMDNADYDPESTDMWKKYKDFVAVRREAPAGVIGIMSWGTMGGSWFNSAIPFTSIQDHYINESDVSMVNFKIGNAHDTLFMNCTNPGESNFTSGLWSGEFNIFYGWANFRIESIDFWAALSMLFVDDIPGVNPLVNFVFHAIAIGTVTFVLFTMALRIYDSVVPF